MRNKSLWILSLTTAQQMAWMQTTDLIFLLDLCWKLPTTNSIRCNSGGLIFFPTYKLKKQLGTKRNLRQISLQFIRYKYDIATPHFSTDHFWVYKMLREPKSKMNYHGKKPFVSKKWVRYKSEIYIIHFTFITDPETNIQQSFGIDGSAIKVKFIYYISLS